MSRMRRINRSKFLGLSAALLAAAQGGCSPEPEVADAATLDEPARETDGGDTSPIGEAGAAEPGPESTVQCEVPRFGDDSDALDFERLTALVVDEAGEAVVNTHAQACGMNVCLFGTTDEQGFALVQPSSPPTQVQRLAFKYGDGRLVAQFANLLEGGPSFELGEQTTIILDGDGEQFAAGRSHSAGGITLTLALGAKVEPDLLTFPREEDWVFVAGQFRDASAWPDALAPLRDRAEPALLIALGPLKTKFCPPARLALENPEDSGLSPGQAVDFYLHVTDVFGEWGPYGDWGLVSTGRVSEDGETIETSEGIPQLGVIAIAPGE